MNPICGIAGFIGKSKYPDVSHQIISGLFSQAETRGLDAAGFWGAASGKDKVIYYKEPIQASEMIEHPMWSKVKDFNSDLLLVHARGASSGVGVPYVNKNNHPFLSSNKRTSLIHNGRIPDIEYNDLRNKYDVVSSCDSEIILRMFEAADYIEEEFRHFGEDIISRLAGIKDIWSYIVEGHMAVAIGEMFQSQNKRRLWLFRNNHRTVYLADCLEKLGQIFFFSTREMWINMALDLPQFNHLFNDTKIDALPEEEIWTVTISDKIDNSLLKFKITNEGSYTPWKPYVGSAIPIVSSSNLVEMITELNEYDEVIKPKTVPGKQEEKEFNEILNSLNDMKSNLTDTYTDLYLSYQDGNLDINDLKNINRYVLSSFRNVEFNLREIRNFI